MRKSSMRLFVFAFIGLFGISFLSGSQTGIQSYNLKAQNYKIEKTKGDFEEIALDGFYSYSAPGYPDLPAKIYYIAVPPDVDEHSIEVNYSSKEVINLGSYRIKEIPPLVTWKDNQQIIGNKAEIYTQNNYFPERVVEYLGVSQMRKWRLVRLRYTPFQYNPETKDLVYIPALEVRITYERKGKSYVSDEELADCVMDERAREIVMNYSESRDWYKPRGDIFQSSTKYDYVIITTSTIKYGYSHYLSGDFLSHLVNKGYNPLIVTELDFGGLTGQYPNGTAEKIRKWLQNNYLTYGIKYVLLIGNPDPLNPDITGDAVGDIPMKACLGRGSDYFYADLTGNWDLDGDGFFGEYYDDNGTGGVDFVNEVYVGRIPYYSGADDLVSVLTKIINYGNTTSILWRRSALLPTSYQDPSTDGAYWAEAMISGYLTGAGFTNWKMYQQGSACAAADSTFTSDEELRGGRTVLKWSNNDYGMVWWQGHGSDTGTSIGYAGCWDGNIITSSDVTSLDDNHPAFVFQSSCNNGAPDASNNLGKSILYDGAIATVCTNETSWYGVGDWSTTWKYVCDDRSIGYYYGEELVTKNKTAGEALFDVKSDMGVNDIGAWKWDAWKNLFGYNLYGDPSVSILENGLGPALDNNNLLFLTVGVGAAVWQKQSTTYYYDGDAAQSGNINDNETVSIYTTVEGPGFLKFYWKVSSEQNYDFLKFYIGGILQDQISGEKGWEQKTYKIPSGLNSLKWSYEKDSSISQGSDCGWVDKVEYFPTTDEKNDFNLDGQGDILWRNYSIGTNVVWYLQSTGSTAGLSQGNLQSMTMEPGQEPAQTFQNPGEAAEILYKDERVYHDVLEVDAPQEKIEAKVYRDALEAGPVFYRPGENGIGGDVQELMMPGEHKAGVQAISILGTAYLNTISNTGWHIEATGDLNGDGNVDILWRHYVSGQNAVWYMIGSVISGTAYLTTITDTLWRIEGTGDFNGDGNTDLLWRHYGTGKNAVWYMNGATIIGTTYLGAITDVNWRIEATGDFNGDGKTDFVWRHYGSGQNAVWYMSGSTHTGTAFLTAVTDVWWAIAGAGDFNGDGNTDLLWRHYGLGANSLWYMNGIAITGTEALNAVGDLSWKIENH